MLKKHLCFFLFTLLVVSCHKGSDSPRNPPSPPQFSQRIKQVIRHIEYPGTGFPEGIFSTEYFYDAQGRVDSITKQKILYAANGRVEKALHYDYYNAVVAGASTYQYNSEGRVESILNQNFNANNQIDSEYKKFFEYNDDGYVVKDWISIGDDKSVITREDGNSTKVQRFYDNTGAEHYLSIASYDDKWNPEYVAGLNSIYPGEYSPKNVTFAQLVSWDCGDYDASPVHYSITYNDEGLPLKSEADNGYMWIEYIYE